MRTPATATHSGQPPRWPWLSVCLLTLVLITGCQNQRQELVESELRCMVQRIEELEKERARLKGEVGQLESELDTQQRKAAKAPQPTGATLIVKRITLGRLTGGYRKDPAILHDDALQVLLEPRDADGASVKAPGTVHIDAYELTPEGLKAPLSGWDITSGELRRTWDAPLIGGPCYRIELPWKAWPTTERLKVVVRFTTLDGQPFEVEKEVDVRLPERRLRSQPTTIPGPPLPTDTVPTLPPPASGPVPTDRAPLILPECPPGAAPAPMLSPGPVLPLSSWRPAGSKPQVQPAASVEPSQFQPPQFQPPQPPQPPGGASKPRMRLLAPVGKQSTTP